MNHSVVIMLIVNTISLSSNVSAILELPEILIKAVELKRNLSVLHQSVESTHIAMPVPTRLNASVHLVMLEIPTSSVMTSTSVTEMLVEPMLSVSIPSVATTADAKRITSAIPSSVALQSNLAHALIHPPVSALQKFSVPWIIHASMASVSINATALNADRKQCVKTVTVYVPLATLGIQMMPEVAISLDIAQTTLIVNPSRSVSRLEKACENVSTHAPSFSAAPTPSVSLNITFLHASVLMDTLVIPAISSMDVNPIVQ